MTRRKLALITLPVLIGIGVAAGVLSTAAGAHHLSDVTPIQLSALNSPSTVVKAPPQAASALGGAYAPAPGTVHSVGGGGAFAWQHGESVCWAAQYAAGCLTHPGVPVDWVLTDPGIAGSPAAVIGLASDGVQSVSVTLKDGGIQTTKPISNFYRIELPTGVRAWDVTGVHAVMSDGSTFSRPIHASAPTSAAAQTSG